MKQDKLSGLSPENRQKLAKVVLNSEYPLLLELMQGFADKQFLKQSVSAKSDAHRDLGQQYRGVCDIISLMRDLRTLMTTTQR